MALEFTDFGLSPEEKVANRKKALESYAGISGEALKEQQQRERGRLLTEAYVGSAKAMQAGQPQAITPMLSKAEGMAAELLPQQAAKQDAANLAGAKMREDIIGSKQEAAMVTYETQTDQMKQQLAQQTANRAFELGVKSSQLALSQDGHLADVGLRQLYSDLEAGRVNRNEVWELSSKMALEARDMQYKIQEEAARLKGELENDLAERNFTAAKARIKKLLDMQKDALQKAAKASNIASILGGIVELGAVGAGYAYGGPAGAAAAAPAAEGASKIVSGLAQK
jgi:hypothetical protein